MRRRPRERAEAGPGLLLIVALVALLASAGLAVLPVRAEVLGVHVDCGASVVAGSHSGEGVFVVQSRLACHHAAGPWRTAALAFALVSLAASVAATIGLRRRMTFGLAVPPPA